AGVLSTGACASRLGYAGPGCESLTPSGAEDDGEAGAAVAAAGAGPTGSTASGIVGFASVGRSTSEGRGRDGLGGGMTASIGRGAGVGSTWRTGSPPRSADHAGSAAAVPVSAR